VNHEELVLNAALTRANYDIGRYVVRILDEDRGGGITEYTRPIGEVEHALGSHLIEVDGLLLARAAERDEIAVDGTATEVQPVVVELPGGPRSKPAVPEF
jgi:hypothetical protein